jgi:hypothetical protein
MWLSNYGSATIRDEITDHVIGNLVLLNSNQLWVTQQLTTRLRLLLA